MKQKFTKLLSLLLVVVMLVSAVPISASAENENDECEHIFDSVCDAVCEKCLFVREVEHDFSDDSYSCSVCNTSFGDCGNSCKWSVQDNVLLIEGHGEMNNYMFWGRVAPWKDYRPTVVKIYVGEGITSIGDTAFYGFTELTEIDLPDSVKKFGTNSFVDCTKLTEMTIPVNLETSDSESWFAGCTSLREFKVEEGNKFFTVEDGVLFNIDKTALWSYPIGSDRTEYKIPDTVKSIESYSFSGAVNLQTVIFNENLEIIKGESFFGCTGLTEISLPESLRCLNYGAFQDCVNLKNISLHDNINFIGGLCFDKTAYFNTIENWDNNVVLYNGKYLLQARDKYTEVDGESGIELTGNYDVKSGTVLIADDAFNGLDNLTGINLPESLKYINWYAFYGCESLSVIDIPENVTHIGACTFYDCTNLADVSLPSGLEHIGYDAFEGTPFIESVVTDENPMGYYMTYVLGSKSSLTEINIKDGITLIAENAFDEATSVKEITLPDSLEYIGAEAFSNTSKTKNVVVPETVKYIGDYAFGFNIYYNNSIDDYVYNKIDNFSLSGYKDSVAEAYAKKYDIPFNYLSNCNHNYEAVVTAPGCTEQGYTTYTCSECGDSYVADYTPAAHPNENSDIYCDICGELVADVFEYSIANGEVTITGYDESFGGDVVIPETIEGYPVTAIRNAAFSYCDSITSVTIPDSVTTIGGSAFYNSSSLSSVKIGNNVANIADYTFYNCSSLTSVIIPDSVESIGEEAFAYCSSLENVTIENNVKNIGTYAFFACTSLVDVTIGTSVESIGNEAFYQCTALTSITIPDSVTSIGEHAFRDCIVLANVEIGNGVTSIGERAFSNCKALTNITIPESVSSIGDRAFSSCSSLIKIIIENPDCEIYDSEYTIDSETIICSYVDSAVQTYAEKYDRKFLDIENNTPENESLLYLTYTIENGKVIITDCDESIKREIVIPSKIEGYPVTEIGRSAFYYCRSLPGVVIPDTVTIISPSAFYYCTSLSNIIIPDSVTSIGYDAFRTSALENVTIPDSVISIDGYAFMDCPALTSVTVGANVASIGMSAFYKCPLLESITILNPDCEIYAYTYTIDPVATIYGYSNSTAQAYAEKYGREFISIGHEHSYTSKVTAPTCTAKGYTTYTCDCGDSYKSDYVNAKGHKGGTATCKAKAKCTVCGTSYGSLASHSYSAATCTKAKTCKTCGVTSGKANGHKYTNACDTSCNTCKATRKITHAYKDVITKATLTKSGKIVNKCSVCGTVKSTKTIAYAKTIKLSATSYTYDGKAKTPSVTVKDSAGKTLKSGTDYTVTYASGRKNVGQYKVTITMKGNYSGTKTLTFNILPGKTSKITATQTTTTLKANWNKVTGATGYKVELLNANGKVIKTVTTKNLTYTFTKLTAGTTYKVRVTAYKTISGKNQYSTVSTTITTATKPATPTLKVTSTKKGVANFTWTNVAGENGYEVYYSTSKSSGFKSLASYKTNVAKGSKSKLTSGKTYYFKVRSFKKVGSTTVYGDWSKVVSVKVK